MVGHRPADRHVHRHLNFKELLWCLQRWTTALPDHAPFERSIPVLGLLGVWYGDFWGANSHAILPYDYYLPRNYHRPPAATRTWNPAERAPGRHASHQQHQAGDRRAASAVTASTPTIKLLHQGTQLIPADFIVPVSGYNPVADHHRMAVRQLLRRARR